MHDRIGRLSWTERWQYVGVALLFVLFVIPALIGTAIWLLRLVF